MSKLSTFGIGGPASYFAEAKSGADMQVMMKFAKAAQLPVFILGKGSNCLFDDAGYNGLVIQNRIDYLNQHDSLFTVGSGYSFARLGQISSRLGWTGLEFASGIPATVGGAVFMNAGANGQQTADSLIEVMFVNGDGEIEHYVKKDFSFGYRTSAFQKKKGAIIEARFKLDKSENAKTDQRKLVEYRLKTQPYKDKSAGCAFRNPSHSSAGKLIDECGLKGLKVGGAEVSLLHANFIVNKGNAKAKDVLTLMSLIKDRIYKEKNILLEEEIRYISADGISS